MTLRERQIENEKLNSVVVEPKHHSVYCSKKRRINIDLSKGQIEQNPLRCI